MSGETMDRPDDFHIRTDIARLLTGRCNNCYSRLPGALGCSVRSPGWNWVTSNFGPFCDECFEEVKPVVRRAIRGKS